MAGNAVRLVDVAGVRVLLATTDGPARGGVVVRLGTADEDQLRAGTAHLVEHLVRAGLPADDGCRTGQVLTRYRCTGSAAEVVAFVSAVCARLADLPTTLAASERRTVAAERAARGLGGEHHLLRARYGLVGYGSCAAPSEYGLDRVTADDLSLAAHAAGTAARCVVWLVTPDDAVPVGLALRLRAGEPLPPPDPRPGYGGERRTVPGWVRTPIGTGGVLGVVDRGPAADAFVAVLRRRLAGAAASLVWDGSRPAPAVRLDVDPVTPDAALLFAGLAAEHAWSGWTPRFTDVVERLAEDVPDDELDACRSAGAAGPGAGPGLDPESVAAELALGTPAGRALAGPLDAPDRAQVRADDVRTDDVRTDDVRTDDVRAVARRFLAGAVAAFDAEGEGSRAWVPEPPGRHLRVDGRRFVRRDVPVDRSELVVAASGISFEKPDTPPVTVRVTSTAVVLRWPDGRRQLVSDDGSTVVVEPTLWEGGDRIVELVDEVWPEELVVERPPRPPEQVPQPDVPAVPAARRSWPKLLTRRPPPPSALRPGRGRGGPRSG